MRGTMTASATPSDHRADPGADRELAPRHGRHMRVARRRPDVQPRPDDLRDRRPALLLLHPRSRIAGPRALARAAHPRVCSAGELATTRNASTSTRSRALLSRSPVEDPAAPLHEFVSNVGNRAFGGAIARSQGAGIMPSGEVHPSVQSTIDSTRGSRHRRSTRGVSEKLSPSLGDLSDVRVHTDSTAHDLNHAVSARAFATGTDVYFAQDQYKPNTLGRRQADRARARARRPAARRAHERAADRLESW